VAHKASVGGAVEIFNTVVTVGTLLFFPLFVGYGIYRVARRSFEVKALVERGVTGTARITRKLRFRGSAMKSGSLRLVYEFTGPDGNAYTGRMMATFAEYNAAEVGHEIPICYLPDRPKVHAPKALVEQSREGYARRKRARHTAT
jgi:hypothetical protein